MSLFLRFAITFSFFVDSSICLHQELHKFVVIIANLCPNVAWAGHGATTPEPPRSPRAPVRIDFQFTVCVRPRIRSCANIFWRLRWGKQCPSTMSDNPPPNPAKVSTGNIVRPNLDALSAKNRTFLEAQLKKVQDSFLSWFEVTRHGGIVQKESEPFVV